MVDPLHSLFSSAPVQEWEQQTGLPPEAAAAQCCFKSKADVKAHLRYAHSCANPNPNLTLALTLTLTSASAMMTDPSAESDWLMLMPSFIVSPLA